jgi:TRAP-type C4-dicarboxylate transport system substrate-binding protein
MRKEVGKLEAGQLEDLKTKMTVNTADYAAFEKAAEAVYKQHEDQFGAMIREIKAVK